jgi:hypothetical protein
VIESRMARLLPLACVAAAVVLFASELMTTFEFIPPGGEVLSDQGGADRHGNALALLAAFAIGAVAITYLTGSKPAAIAVAACGGVSLLVFLLVDLPDANAVGTLDDVRASFFDAEAVPRAGFFMELLGSLALTVCGIALATMTPEQLNSLRPPKREKTSGPRPGGLLRSSKPAAPGEAKVKANAEAAKPVASDEADSAKTNARHDEPKHRLLSRRPRARQRG